ncbi:Putative proximal rod protein [Oligella ureolytica]|uniref:Flagellar basal-body rod protein FlgC n=1 Tax=Oligella ureolytica TaxID=90244 RepID=A0A378XFK9_9BURK|nr:flagellar basal body rod protein FlgC [Oligella ureolytica]QPT39107.1 flagellar basal body rod protein FlgC [Oligella ureolytica]SUA54822.1 Putative proximal rod protein [Oligella ureolytica]SUA56012.1 Putative proximal rod protein [Oligella ureolytica]
MSSMMSIFEISGSALNAGSQRLNVIASNLANAQSVAGPDGQAYKAKQVVFQMAPLGNAQTVHPIGGVQVSAVVESQAPMRLQYDPKSPHANSDGYVTLPNVDVVAETVNMIAASRSYQANVEVVNTAKALMMKTLALGQ